MPVDGKEPLSRASEAQGAMWQARTPPGLPVLHTLPLLQVRSHLWLACMAVCVTHACQSNALM